MEKTYVSNDDGNVIAVFQGENAAANAFLFNAAPKLLKELKNLVNLLEPLEKAGDLNVPGLATLNRARWAIESAR